MARAKLPTPEPPKCHEETTSRLPSVSTACKREAHNNTYLETEWLKNASKSRPGRSPSTPLGLPFTTTPPFLKRRSNSSPAVSDKSQVATIVSRDVDVEGPPSLPHVLTFTLDMTASELPEPNIINDATVNWASATVNALDQVFPEGDTGHDAEMPHDSSDPPRATAKPPDASRSRQENDDASGRDADTSRFSTEDAGRPADPAASLSDHMHSHASQGFEDQPEPSANEPDGLGSSTVTKDTCVPASGNSGDALDAGLEVSSSASTASSGCEPPGLRQPSMPKTESPTVLKLQGGNLTPQQKRLHALTDRNINLQRTLDELAAERNKLALQLRDLTATPGGMENAASNVADCSKMSEADLDSVMGQARATIKEHITLLHKYNDIRDVAQGLMGMIADQRGVRMREVQEDFGLDERD